MKRIFTYLSYSILFMAPGCRNQDVASDCMGEPTDVACYQLYDPVCGCNGITYGNACTAQASGVKSYIKGECTKN